jgi:hypothetical protein
MKLIYTPLFLCLFGCATTLNKPKPTFEATAIKYLREYNLDCTKEGAGTWGVSLCVPMMIVDRETMKAVVSEPDPQNKFQKIEDAYVGVYYGDPIYANTSIQWGGTCVVHGSMATA